MSEVPVPGICRACGAALAPDLPWCAGCYEPVRLFTPRPRQSATPPPPAPPPVAYSRWRAGPTSFGPAGRLAITAGLVAALVLGIGGMLDTSSWGFALWFLLGWSLTASLILRATWRKEPVVPGEPVGPASLARLRARVRARAPWLARDLPPSAATVGAVGTVVAVVVALWLDGDAMHRFFLAVGLAGIGLGLLIGRLNDL